MLFNSEPRFNKDLKPQKFNDISGYGKICETERHVGPGSYFSERNEDVRGGWHHKSFSQRQPMTSSSRRDDRTIHYTNGLLLPSGILVPGSPKKMPTPGPGYYGGPLSPTKRPKSATSPSSTMGTSPRMLEVDAVVRNGIIFQNATKPLPIGPGYYSSPKSDLVKPSFNIRATPQKSPSSNSPNSHSRYSSRNNSFNHSPSRFGNGYYYPHETSMQNDNYGVDHYYNSPPQVSSTSPSQSNRSGGQDSYVSLSPRMLDLHDQNMAKSPNSRPSSANAIRPVEPY